MVVLKDNMSLKDFKKYCAEKDTNITSKWNYESFKIVCQKCKSEDVVIVDDLKYNGGSNCPTCGFDGYNTGKIIIKCISCGNGMQIVDSEDLN